MLLPKEVDPTLLDRLERLGDKLKKKKLILSKTAQAVIKKRYLKKDDKGQPAEEPEDMFWRVSCNIAFADLHYNPWTDVEKKAKEFYNLMSSFEFLPNSPTLMNAGRELQQLSACFVLPVEDSMDSIFEAVKSTAIIHKTGGGTGFSFNKLRPKNDRVASTGGVASGPISFMKVFNAATDVIKQGGTRRGANMAILNVDHPDILEFINAKRDNSQLTNFNISVGITEDFMEKVKGGQNYQLINPKTLEVIETLNAREVFDLIVERAWENGEPGIVFIDRLNGANPTPHVGTIESTNPCGEQPLLPYEACNLGSINLVKMLKETEGDCEVDFEKLENTVNLAIRFLDNVIDVNKYPLPQIEKMAKSNRKIGLGIMGFADMLILLKIPYNSQQALDKAEEIMKFIQEKARLQSSQIAKERGVFPNYDGSIYDINGELRLRNATVTTIAPTGTLSIIAGTSSGIEPLFGICFIRRILSGEEFVEVNPQFEKMIEERGFFSEELMRKVAERGTIRGMKEIPEDIQNIFITTYDVLPKCHVMIQSAFQKYTDNAVSKTVNFPPEATKDEVREVFLLAFDQGCKGVTIYRHGTRAKQVISVGSRTEKEIKEDEKNIPAKSNSNVGFCEDLDFDDLSHLERINNLVRPRSRPEITFGLTEKIDICSGKIYVTVNYDEYGVCEVVLQSSGINHGCNLNFELLSRFITLAASTRIQSSYIFKQLKGYRCSSCISAGGKAASCVDEVSGILERAWRKANNFKSLAGSHSRYRLSADAFESIEQDICKDSGEIISVKHYKESTNSRKEDNKVYKSFSAVQNENSVICPECRGGVEYVEGCMLCRTCGFSKCG